MLRLLHSSVQHRGVTFSRQGLKVQLSPSWSEHVWERMIRNFDQLGLLIRPRLVVGCILAPKRVLTINIYRGLEKLVSYIYARVKTYLHARNVLHFEGGRTNNNKNRAAAPTRRTVGKIYARRVRKVSGKFGERKQVSVMSRNLSEWKHVVLVGILQKHFGSDKSHPPKKIRLVYDVIVLS